MTATETRAPAALRVSVALLLFIALKAAGNLSLAWGMKYSAPSLAGALLDPFVAIGVVALILAVLMRMVLLSLADLSYVLPVTAIGYVLAAFLGKTVLHETVSSQRWLGIALIFVGAALVGSTAHSTTEVNPR